MSAGSEQPAAWPVLTRVRSRWGRKVSGEAPSAQLGDTRAQSSAGGAASLSRGLFVGLLVGLVRTATVLL